MSLRLTPLPRPDVLDRPRPFPALDRAFDAVEAALARLGIEDPATLRSPRPVEEVLAPTAIPAGTLLVLDPEELLTAEDDVIETMKDERSGGTSFVSVPDRLLLLQRRSTLRELAVITPTFLFAADSALPPGLTRMKRVVPPEAIRGYRFVVADTAGFRVALVSRALPVTASGTRAWIGLWTGDPEVVDQVTGLLRRAATAAGPTVPAPAPAVPALEGVASVEDVWRQAEELRAHRVVREAELREIARAAALKGVQIRRDREEQNRAAS